MSRRYPNNRSEYGLSSDDDEEAGVERSREEDGCVDQRYLRPGHVSPSRPKGQRWKPGGGQSAAMMVNSPHQRNKTLQPSSDSLSLAEFEKEYIDDDDYDGMAKRRGYGGEMAILKGGTFPGVSKWLKTVVEWLVMTSKWKVALVGCLLGLSFAVVHQSCWWLLSDPSSG